MWLVLIQSVCESVCVCYFELFFFSTKTLTSLDRRGSSQFPELPGSESRVNCSQSDTCSAVSAYRNLRCYYALDHVAAMLACILLQVYPLSCFQIRWPKKMFRRPWFWQNTATFYQTDELRGRQEKYKCDKQCAQQLSRVRSKEEATWQ